MTEAKGKSAGIPEGLFVSAELRTELLFGLGAFAAIFVLQMLWSIYDYRYPTQDEAIHIMNGMAFKDLLLHFRPWHHEWWSQCYTVSAFYPPLVYVVGGLFDVVFGQSRLIEHAYMAAFSGLMVLSIYSIARQSGGGYFGSLCAGLFISAYPMISWLNHTFFLDMPAVAMTAFALAVLLWWNSFETPSVLRTVLCGIAIGAACMTKQMVVAYLLPALLFFLVKGLAQLLRRKELLGYRPGIPLTHTIGVLVIAILISLPFAFVSYGIHRGWLSQNVEAFAAVGVHHTFIGNFCFYLGLLRSEMSATLLCIFVVSLFFLRSEYRRLALVICSALGGLLLTCTSAGTDLEERYLVPFLIAPAIISAFFIQRLVLARQLWPRTVGMILVTLVIAEYVVYNFSPYPLPISQPFLRSLPMLSTHNGNPRHYEDWGYSFVVDTIHGVDGNKPVFLNILSNHDVIHVNALTLYLREHSVYTIFPTSSRVWTIVGDRVRFDPATACYPMWYLIKTGDNGFRFCDNQSILDCAKLTSFIQAGSSYRLVSKKSLPDQSELMLYRRTF